jgi:hypothetical protein
LFSKNSWPSRYYRKIGFYNFCKYFDHFSLRMHPLTKDILTTKITKATKGSDVFDHKLRALRVLRGKTVLSYLVGASPGQEICSLKIRGLRATIIEICGGCSTLRKIFSPRRSRRPRRVGQFLIINFVLFVSFVVNKIKGPRAPLHANRAMNKEN